MAAPLRPVLTLVVLLALPWSVTCTAGGRFDSTPISLRVEGFVGATPDGTVPQATWVVRVQGKEYTLQVMRLEVLAGNTSYFDIIAALEPYTYAFTVYGDDQAVQTLTQASAGRTISMIGHAQLAQLPGLFFISSIAVTTHQAAGS
jgi:hypothetical protein